MLCWYLSYDNGVYEVFVLSLFYTFCCAPLVYMVLSLGMGWDAPQGRSVSVAYEPATKGLLNVKKDLCGRRPPRGNTRGSGGFCHKPCF